MSQLENTSDDIVKRANEVLKKAQQALTDTNDFYRSNGLNPEKVHKVLSGYLTPKEIKEAELQFQKDQQDIEREVSEEAARLKFAYHPTETKTAKKMRPMV